MATKFKVILVPSWRVGKKFAVIFLQKEEFNLPDNTIDLLTLETMLKRGKGRYTVHFGAQGYEDYTDHKSDLRKKLYMIRHRKNENWDDIMSAGYWAYHLLWTKPTIEEAIKYIEGRDPVEIIDRR
jgi:hypothetical protein